MAAVLEATCFIQIKKKKKESIDDHTLSHFITGTENCRREVLI